MTRWPPALRRATAGVVALAAIYLLAWAAVPALLKWQGEKQGTAWLGRDLRIGRVGFAPWKLDLTFENVEVLAAAVPAVSSVATDGPKSRAPTTAPLLSVGRLHLDLAWASLWQRAPVVQALEIDAMRLRVSRLAPGRYDIDDVIGRFATKPEATASELVHFALYNVQLRDAGLVFDDRPASRIHTVTDLHLAVPLLSNLPAQVDIKVEPRLSFLLNGVPFDSGALATPFATTRSGELQIKFVGLDMAPYLGYLPETLPLRVKAATLTTDLSIEFALPPGSPPTLDLHGTMAMTDVQIVDSGASPLLAWHRLDLDVRSATPLTRRLAISSMRVEGARCAVRRDANGKIDLLQLGAGGADVPTGPGLSPTLAPASAANRGVPSAPPAWRVEVDRFSLADAAATWTDAAVEPAVSLQIDGLAAELTKIAWPIEQPLVLAARASIHAGSTSAVGAGGFTVEGTATDRTARLKLSLTSLPIEALDAYLAQSLTPELAGLVSAQGRIDWSGAAPDAGGLQVVLDTGTIDGLTLRERGSRSGDAPPAELAAAGRLSVTDAKIDLPARTVTVGGFAVERPSLSLARAKDGRFDVERWRVATPSPAAPPGTSSPAIAADASWRVLLREGVLTGGHVDFADALPAGMTSAKPLRVAVEDLRVAVQNLAWQGDRPTVPAQIEVSGRVGAPREKRERGSPTGGSIDWRGVVGVAPVLATGSLRVERLPVHLFMPYVGLDLGLRLARAELGYAGNLSVKALAQGLDVDAGADVLLGAVDIESAPSTGAAETLVRWNTLGLKGVRLSMKPGARPRIDIAQAALDDFYTRLVVTESGALNLASVTTPGGAKAEGPVAPLSATAAAKAELPVDFGIGATELTNGRIDFSDDFVRPNYSAALTELTGRLGPLRSDSREMAALTLRGKAAGTALLDITGAVNPIARPLALDIHAKATDLELAPLSTYAGKYAGYAIERGKLSMDVSYRIDADGRLEAKNQVVLNQLTFGEKIESPTATKLPVLLAVALLKDRNGVIDLDLPISGSLADPQFSVGGIIVRLLGNLLVKAITSPFALLSGGSGGGGTDGDAGRVEFVSGTTRLAGAGVAAVDKVATALLGKPKLVLTVTGSVDPAAEQEAYRGAVLEERLEAVQKKRTVATAAAASAATARLDGAARDRLLRELYGDSDLPDKPKNVLGFAKDVPTADMEARLKARIPVDADTMRAIALQRGVTVRDALIEKGLSSDRLFLAAPQLRAPSPQTAPIWVPQAQLSLSVN